MKLLSLLKALEPFEYKEFEKFLQSPFFTGSKHCLAFFRHLRKHYPDFEPDKAALENAYRRCIGKDDFTDSKLYNLLSHLSHLAENFFIVKQALDGDTTASRPRRELLVKALARRNAVTHFRAEAQRLVDDFEEKKAKDASDYGSLKQLYHALYFHPDISQNNPEAPALQGALDNLNLHYFMSMLRLLAEIKTRQKLMPDKHQIPLEQVVLEQTAEPGLQVKHPLIHIYHRFVKLYDNASDETGFRELKDLFLKNFDLLSPLEQRYLLKHLANYGASLARQKYPVQAELLELYKKNIEAGALLTAGRLTYVAYLNIINLAIGRGEQKWIKWFAKEFSPYLEEQVRQGVSQYAQALLHYSSDDLDAAHSQLDSSVFSVPVIVVEGRILLLKIAFDRYVLFGKDYDFLASSLNTFEKYLLRQEVAQEKKDAYLNFIRFLRKMALRKSSKPDPTVMEEVRQSLREKLKNLKSVINARWLEQRIEML